MYLRGGKHGLHRSSEIKKDSSFTTSDFYFVTFFSIRASCFEEFSEARNQTSCGYDFQESGSSHTDRGGLFITIDSF